MPSARGQDNSWVHCEMPSIVRVHVDGLWGMQFGSGVQAQKTNSLFWAAGPNDEADGALGDIDVVDSD